MPLQRNGSTPILPLSLLRRGAGLLGVLGVIGSSTVWAQTAPPVPTSAPAILPETPIVPPVSAAPSAPESLPIVEGLSKPDAEALPPIPTNSPADATSFIDSTDYSIGATRQGDAQRSQPSQASPLAPTAPLQTADAPAVPSIAQPLAINDPGLSVVGQTTPTARDFYKRTLLPPGRLGNGSISLLFPLALPAPITSAFGWRMHPISGDRRFHSGTDLGAPMGTPVLAAYDGRVAIADFLGGYGLSVTLEHNNGTQQTLYAHLSEIFVRPGDQVKQGAVVGRVGSTGNSTGPHLHFEFRQRNSEGWVVMDAGTQLEYALSQFAKTLSGSPEATLAPQTGNDVTGTAKLKASIQTEGKLLVSRAPDLTELIRSFTASRGIRLPENRPVQ
ncbi:MAG TPA: peptidoglycan DD-metalloendopeptidase family protein [Thermosynechococcaceae cyanobacterium]